MTRRRLGFLIAAGCLYLTGLGFLTGMVVERARFDRLRGVLLRHLAATQERLHTHRSAEMMPPPSEVNDGQREPALRQVVTANGKTPTQHRDGGGPRRRTRGRGRGEWSRSRRDSSNAVHPEWSGVPQIGRASCRERG